MRRLDRAVFVHITWQRHGGRAREISSAMGGRALHVHPRALTARRWVVLRYLTSAVLTVAGLLQHRPRSVAVTNPPVVPGLIVAAYCALTRTPFLLDSHTSSFGVKGNVIARRSLGVHRWLARRSVGVMVTTPSWVEEVGRWGARGIVAHEAPPAWAEPERPAPRGRPLVLFVGVFSGDEPVEEVVAAARELPDVDFAVTGPLELCPPRLQATAPRSVSFVGFLGPEDYRRQLEEADVVMALTTEPTSVMRAAYEGVYAKRALVVTDWPVLREVFPLAHHAPNRGVDLAVAVRSALAETPLQRAKRAGRARSLQLERWQRQASAMEEALGVRGLSVKSRGVV